MKKINLFVIIFALSFVLSACGAEKSSDNSLAKVADNQPAQVLNPVSESDVVTEANPTDVRGELADAKLVDVATWLTMERPREKFSVKHPKAWYYVSNSTEAKEAGFGALIGFGDSSLVWEQNPPYAIEVISIKKDSDKSFDNYNVVAGEDDNNKFIIRADEKYKEIVDLMVESFQVLK